MTIPFLSMGHPRPLVPPLRSENTSFVLTLASSTHSFELAHFRLITISIKRHLYRHEVTEVAIQGLLETIAKFESHTFVPKPLDYSRQDVKGRLQASMKQADRAIEWRDSTASVLRKIRYADSFPSVLARMVTAETFYISNGLKGQNRMIQILITDRGC